MPGAFAAEHRTTRAFIGLVTVELGSPRGGTEISYTLLPEWWGRGLGREAVAATVEWARKLPGEFPVVAVTQSANTGSRRLLEAIGLSAHGEVVEYGEPQTVYCDLEMPRVGAPSRAPRYRRPDQRNLLAIER